MAGIAPAPKSQPRLAVPQDETTEHQVAYKPTSEAPSLGTLIPKNMATPTREALAAAKERHGDLNTFVEKELGYPAGKIGDYFGAEQVDALALAIDNFKQGSAFVVGSQTGVGKGRIAAAMMRFAQRQGLVPVFVTKGPNLFADMVRDLSDIGINSKAHPFNVLPTNELTGDNKLPLPDGRTLATTSDHKNVVMRAVSNFLEGNGLSAAVKGEQRRFDAIFTTYSQMQSVQGNETFRQQALRRLRRQAYFILDESHEAGGTRQGGWRSKDEPAVGGRAGFVRELIKDAPGVLYSSATYAKRPEVMDLYGRTDMRLAVNGDLDKLPEAIAKGGVPLQQAVAAMLSKAGQYIRHERSFKGVDFKPEQVDIGLDKADAVSGIFRAIRDFDQLKQGAVDDMEDDLVAGGERYGNDTSTGEAGIKSSNFTAIIHNIVNQALLSLKVDRMAEAAIDAMKRGEKPVITIDNTMESALERHINERALRVGDPVDMTFKDVLRRYLERSREVVINDEDGKGTQHYLTDEELGAAGVKAYKAASKLIDEAKLDLPASPIDRLLQKLEGAGLRVGEITGRNWRLKYAPDDSATLAERPKEESSSAGRVRAVSDFNSGKLDALILNRAGSTGLSLHAHPAFADTRRRHMIIGQPALNVDEFMQMLGRVHRTGQIVPPAYTLLLSNAPAENRPAAALVKKLASLNANVTAARTGAVNFDVPDIMNQVGDEVVADYLDENEEMAEMMGNPLGRTPSGAYASENAAAKVSGRAVLLPVADQQRFWNDVVSRYTAKLEELDAIGENPLAAKTLDLDAVTTRTMPLFAGKRGSTSPFAGPADLNEVDMKLVGKPLKSEQVSEKLRTLHGVERDGQIPEAARKWARENADALGEATATYRTKRLAGMKEADAAARVDSDIQRNLNAVTGFMDRMPPGTPVYLTTPGGDSFEGVVLDIAQRGKPKNPAAAGSWLIHVAVADAARQVNVPISATSDFRGGEGYDIQVNPGRLLDALPAFDHAASKSRETRFIATGNLLAAYDKLSGGQIINYTAREGGTKQGILLPKKFDLSAYLDREPVKFDTPDNAYKFLDGGHELSTPDQGLRVIVAGAGRLVLEAAKSKSRGGQYVLNAKLLGAAKPDEFVSAGNKMRLTIEDDRPRAMKVLRTAMNEWGLVAHKDKEAAREAMGMPSLAEKMEQMKAAKAAVGGAPPRRPNDRGGYIATDFAQPIVAVAKAAGETAKFVIDYAVRDVIDRVRQQGTPAAKQAADLAEKALNTSKAAMGKLHPDLEHALKLTGGGLSPMLHKAVYSLQRVEQAPGASWGVARIVDAVEGRAVALTAHERHIVNAIRKLTDTTGQMLAANGVQQLQSNGQWAPFRYIPGGKVFVRNMTGEGMGILMRGPAAPGWKQWVDGIATMSNVPRAEVEKQMREMRDGLLGEGPDAATKQINAEFSRQFPRVPTHLIVGRTVIPVLHTFPFTYAKSLADRTAARVGVVKQFGQDTHPGSPIAQLRRDYARETGNPKPLTEMLRALAGIPIAPPILNPHSSMATVARGLEVVGSVIKSGLLSLSALQHVAEPIGSIQAFGGAGDLLKAVWQVSRHPQATLATLQSMGALASEVADLSFQRGRPFTSAARILHEITGRVPFVYRHVHDFKARLAGALATEMVERLAQGKGGAGDVYDLMKLGWELPDARRIARGGGTQGEMNRIVRQVPAKLLGSNMLPSERSRLASNRIARAAVAFQSWFEMKVRSTLKEAEAYAKVMAHGNNRERLAANVKFGRSVAGTTTSHIAAYFLLAAATGGAIGLTAAWREMKEHPVRFLRDSLIYSHLAGPYGAVLRLVSGSGKFDWVHAIFPVFVVHEIGRYVTGQGEYEGKGWMDRTGVLLSHFLPADKVFATTAAAFGFHRDQERLAVAERQYWRWRRAEHPTGHYESAEESTEAQRKFNVAMRGVYQDVLAQRDPTAHIAAAFGAGKGVSKGKLITQEMATRMREHELLSNAAFQTDQATADKLREEARQRLGDEAYTILLARDAVLESWAAAFKLADTDPESVKEYQAKYGQRLANLEHDLKTTPPATPQEDELQNRSRRIDRMLSETRKAPITPQRRREERGRALNYLLPSAPAAK